MNYLFTYYTSGCEAMGFRMHRDLLMKVHAYRANIETCFTNNKIARIFRLRLFREGERGIVLFVLY